jgi:hypothetical protein
MIAPDPVDIESIWAQYYIAPVDATFNKSDFTTIEGKNGYGFDLESAKATLEAAKYGTTVEIPFTELAPTINGEELSKMLFRDVLATYTGTATSDKDRDENLRLACSAIDGTVLYPGDFFSYNETDGDFEMKNFSVERDKKLLLPLIFEALKRQKEMQMFASPWCPPLWLKTKRAYSYGVFNKTEENLKAYALYFKKYVEAYHKKGVPLVHIHPQNEPCSNQVFPSCVWTGSELADFIDNFVVTTEDESSWNPGDPPDFGGHEFKFLNSSPIHSMYVYLAPDATEESRLAAKEDLQALFYSFEEEIGEAFDPILYNRIFGRTLKKFYDEPTVILT